MHVCPPIPSPPNPIRPPPSLTDPQYTPLPPPQVSAAEYKAYEANQAKNGGMDPLEASRQKAKQAAQN